MQGRWVAIALILFPSILFAQAELSLKSDALKFPASRVACETNGSDLFITIGDIETKTGTVLTALLRNYGTVSKNLKDLADQLRDNQPVITTFPINDPTVGAVSLIDGPNHWRVHNAPGFTADSKCDVSVTAASAKDALSITLSCNKLSLLSDKLTLNEKKARMIETVELTEPVSCVPRKRN
jgi:hypothetical protein